MNVERELHRSIVNPANVTISGSSAKLIKNGIAPLPFPLPALLKEYGYIKRGGEGQGTCSILCNVRIDSALEHREQRASSRIVARAVAAEGMRRKCFSRQNPPPYVGGYHS